MEEKTTDMHTAAEPAMETEDRILAAMQTLAARIDVTDPQLQHRYGESVLKAWTQALSDAEKEGLFACTASEEHFSLSSEPLAAVNGLKLWLTKLFCGAAAREESLQKQYEESAQKVSAIAEKLELRQLGLTKEIEKLDELSQRCRQLHGALSVYHRAGKHRLRREKETTLSSKKEIARRTGLSRDAQNVRQFEDQCRLFEARLHMLEGKISYSEAILPQVQLLKDAKADLARTIQTFLLGEVPAWQETAGSAQELHSKEEGLRLADKTFAAAMDRLTAAEEETVSAVASAGKTLSRLAQELGADITE